MPAVSSYILKSTQLRLRSLRKAEGSSLIELALVSAILFAVLFGVIQFAYAFYAYNFVSEVTREAARYAIVRGSTSCTNTPNLSKCNASPADIQSYVQGLGYPGLSSSNLTVTTTWCAASVNPTSGSMTWSSCSAGTSKAPGNAVNVAVTYAFPLNIPFWKKQTVNLSSTAQMVVAQ